MNLANPSAYNAYRTNTITTASPIDLIVMLYDGYIKQMKLASIHIGEKNIQGANDALQRAVDIVMELINSLDFHYPIANELMDIYHFCVNETLDINDNKDKERIPALIEVFTTLKEAWQEVAKTHRASQRLTLTED